MSDWTTDHVRIAAREGAVAMQPLFMHERPAARDEAAVSFDRWLAAHDAEVRARTLRLAAHDLGNWDASHPFNIQSVVDFLRVRAAARGDLS